MLYYNIKISYIIIIIIIMRARASGRHLRFELKIMTTNNGGLECTRVLCVVVWAEQDEYYRYIKKKNNVYI